MKIMKLGDICEISTGSTDTKDATVGGLYPLFDRSKKVKASSKYLFDCEALIMPGEGAEFLPRHYVGKFDLHQRAYAMFNFSELVDPRYLYFYLISVKHYFADNAVGATVKSLRRRHFTDLEVPLPSLTRQCSLVKKLDAAFDEIERLESNLEICEEKINQYFQSLLSSNFRAKAVFRNGSKATDRDFTKMEFKASVPFHEIFSIIPDTKSKIKSSAYLPIGRNAVVDQGKGLIAGYTDGVLTVEDGDLPVIVFGDHTRAVKFVDFPFTAGADGTQILKPSSLTNPRFAYYLILHAVSQIPSKGYARHFGDLKKICFDIPSLQDQLIIADLLDESFAELENYRNRISVKKDFVGMLRQSLLSDAFSVSQEMVTS